MKLATTLLIFCVAALLAVGLVMLYSSSMVQVGSRYLVKQFVWCLLGCVACVTAASLDYRRLKTVSWLLYGGTMLLLGLVLVAGTRVNGARRWLEVAGFTLQPSEFAKIALVLALAHYGERFQRQMPTFGRGLVLPGILIGLILGLIFVEPDRGTTILLAVVSVILLLIAGVRWRYVIPPAIVAVAALGVSLWLDPMRSERIYSWLHLEETRLGKGMQAYQSMLALGSGGVSGLGLGNGRQKLGFVPEHHTDFIFSIIGEELGLVATLGIVTAFMLLVGSGLYIASRARDPFGLLLASGITFLIGLQACINIGVVTSALPNKGLSLPFISYGGSNLLVMLTGIGLLLSVARVSAANAPAHREAGDEMPHPQTA